MGVTLHSVLAARDDRCRRDVCPQDQSLLNAPELMHSNLNVSGALQREED